MPLPPETANDLLQWVEQQFEMGAYRVGTNVSGQEISKAAQVPYSKVRTLIRVLHEKGAIESGPGKGVIFIKDPRAGRQQSRVIGIVIPTLHQQAGYYHLLVDKLDELSRRDKCAIEVRTFGAEATLESAHLSNIDHWQGAFVDGLRVPDELPEPLDQIPVVALGHNTTLPSAGWNRAYAGWVAGTALIRQLLSFYSHPTLYFFAEREGADMQAYLEGFRKAASDHPLRPPQFDLGIRPGAEAPANSGTLPRLLAGRWSRGFVDPRNVGRFLAAVRSKDLLEVETGFGILAVGAQLTRGLLEGLDHYKVAIPSKGLVLALEEDFGRTGGFLSTVQPNPPDIALAAWQVMTSATKKSVDVSTALIRGKRSLNNWLLKLFRGMYGSAVIKDFETGSLQYANPAFETINGKVAADIRGERPTQYWPSPIGTYVEALDEELRGLVRQRPSLSLVTVEYFRLHQDRARYTIRFPFQTPASETSATGGQSFIGTVGFEARKEELLVLLPTHTNGDEPSDPDNDVLEAFFENLPCSVLIEEYTEGLPSTKWRTIYANRAFRNLWPGQSSILGQLPGSYRDGFPHADELDRVIDRTRAPQWYPLTKVHKTAPPPGGRGISRTVLYFFLYDSYYRRAAVASIGWNEKLIGHINSMLPDPNHPVPSPNPPWHCVALDSDGYLVDDGG